MKNIKKLVKDQKEYFLSGETKGIKFRIAQLKKLRKAILANKETIIKALWEDFHKSEYAAQVTADFFRLILVDLR